MPAERVHDAGDQNEMLPRALPSPPPPRVVLTGRKDDDDIVVLSSPKAHRK